MNASIPDRYDAQNAKTLVNYCASAYVDGTNDPGVRTVFESPLSDGRVVVYNQPQDTIIAFRGTVDLKQWLEDLDAIQIEQDGALVHRGFWDVLATLQPVLTIANCGMGEGKRIWVTGHSLGGALALLWSWIFVKQNGYNPFSGIYTFGQPRVGNQAFRDSCQALGLDTRTFRVVHAQDLIPRVPWAILPEPYFHLRAHEVFFPVGSTTPILDPHFGALIVDDIEGISEELWHNQFGLTEDHHMAQYQALYP